MQGVSQFNGGLLETGTAGVSQPAAVRPFMNLNFGEIVNNSASGSRPQPVIQDFIESQVPSSQDPLLFSKLVLGADNKLHQNTHWWKPMPVDVKLAACLHCLVSGSSYLLCSDRFGIGASTLQEAMPDVVKAIVRDLGPFFLTWPDAVEVQRVSETFQRHCSLPNVVGAIDGSQIKIRNPERRHARDYFNRKRDISIVLQAICNHDSAFLDISCGAPGSVHNSRCLHLSSIFWRVEAGEVMVDSVVPINDGFQLHPYLLGDQGYAMHPWLMVPFSLTGMSPRAQHFYNRKLVQGRLSIERAFGLLKARFRILENGITSSVGWAGKLVHATCILHNVIVKHRLGHDDVATALEPVLRRERAARNLPMRRQGRPDRPDSGHEMRDALIAYVMSRNT
ncbi:hypothetical protein R1flu_015918 [Riccia fluitans]|uniref:DDE Tnp4 domain-containing protein n=1 Tax=Riccia fluitans TaxID=41844 RepID=A0ABD1YKD8_9MARC